MGNEDKPRGLAAACETCGARPAYSRGVGSLPISLLLCDECAASSFVITPGRVLFALVVLGLAAWWVWSLL